MKKRIIQIILYSCILAWVTGSVPAMCEAMTSSLDGIDISDGLESDDGSKTSDGLESDDGSETSDSRGNNDDRNNSDNREIQREELQESGKEVAVNEKGTLTIGYVKIGAESDWRLACNKSLTEAFTPQNGYYLLTSDAQQKQEKQIKAVREFINQEVDYILLDPITEGGWDASLEEAKEAGIPVIVFDREVDVEEPDAYTTWLGSDFYLEGQKACAWLEAYLNLQGYEDVLNIVHIQGTINSSAQLGRSLALDEALETHKDWHLLAREGGEFTTAKGKEVMVDMLAEFGDEIQVVYCENDNEAYGAIEAIRESGRKAGCDLADGEILVLSFDATRSGLNMTLSGQIAVNTECAPEYGPLLTQLIQALERDEELPYRQYVREEQFSSLEEPVKVVIDENSYEVTILSQDLIDERTY